MASVDDGTKLTSVTVMRSSAAERNKAAILDALKRTLPEQPLLILEIASGTGQHVAYLAEHLPLVTWQPSECDEKSVTSIQGYIQITQRPNIRDPVWIKTTDKPEVWGKEILKKENYDVMLCINMLHACAWKATEGLFKGCEYFLKSEGIVIIFGPFKVDGETCPENNTQLDNMLRQQNSEWGLRNTTELKEIASANRLLLESSIDMPSNQKMLIFRKQKTK